MRLPWSLGFLIGMAGIVGCGDPPRTIETAKPIAPPTTSNSLTELPTLARPESSDPAAVTIIEATIAAHTNKSPERLKKLKAVTLVREGPAITFTQVPTPQHWQLWLAWPGRMRYRVEIPGLPIVTLGNNHREAWKHLGNILPPVRDAMSPTDAEDFRLDATGDWLLMMHPLQLPETRFAKLPDVQVNNKPALAIRVWVPELSDAILAIDPSTNLIVQILYDGREQNRKTLKEFLILDHKEFLGVKLPEKLVYKSNGSQLAEFTLKSVEALDPVEAKLFTDP